MSTPSQPTTGPDNTVPSIPAAQSPLGTGAQSQPPPPATSATHPVGAVVPNAAHEVPPIVVQRVQAAQLEHKLESPSDSSLVHGPSGPSNCALAGGASAPQSPLAGPAPSPAKKRRQKRRDNHVSVRFDTEEDDVISRRMERTGESQSDAIRAIIRESEHKTGHVFLSPKAPPEALEVLLGTISKWRKEFASAKPRLNIATPTTDVGRHAEVQKWRKEADRLLLEIPNLEAAVSAAMRALTSLTTERAAFLMDLLTTFKRWRKVREEKGETHYVQMYQAVIDLIEDMGITEREKK